MAQFEYRLVMVKGGEITVEHLIGPSEYDDEIDESDYDVDCTGLYLTDPEGNETELELPEALDDVSTIPADETVELNDEQYVKYVCWRTTEWVLTSDRRITEEDFTFVPRRYGDVCITSFVLPDDIECEFDSSWDGKYSEILQEARNPKFVVEEEEDD